MSTVVEKFRKGPKSEDFGTPVANNVHGGITAEVGFGRL